MVNDFSVKQRTILLNHLNDLYTKKTQTKG